MLWFAGVCGTWPRPHYKLIIIAMPKKNNFVFASIKSDANTLKWHLCKWTDVHTCSARELSVWVQHKYRNDCRLHGEKLVSSSFPAWHTCSVKIIAPNGTNSGWFMVCLRETAFFSKTLVSASQISCPSSAFNWHNSGEKAVPYQQCVNQTHKDMLTDIDTTRHRSVADADGNT